MYIYIHTHVQVRDISVDTPVVREQIPTGKCVILRGRDVAGRPVMILRVKEDDPTVRYVYVDLWMCVRACVP